MLCTFTLGKPRCFVESSMCPKSQTEQLRGELSVLKTVLSEGEVVGCWSIPPASAQQLLAFWNFWRWCLECNQIRLRRQGGIFLQESQSCNNRSGNFEIFIFKFGLSKKKFCFWGSAAKQLLCHRRRWKFGQRGGLGCSVCYTSGGCGPTGPSDVLLQSKSRVGWSGCVLTRL